MWQSWLIRPGGEQKFLHGNLMNPSQAHKLPCNFNGESLGLGKLQSPTIVLVCSMVFRFQKLSALRAGLQSAEILPSLASR